MQKPNILVLVENVTDSGKSAVAAKLTEEHGYEKILTCSTGPVTGDTYPVASVAEFQSTRYQFVESTCYEDPRYDPDDFEEDDEPFIWRGTDRRDLERGTGYKVCVVPPESAEQMKKAFPDSFVVNLTQEELPKGFVPDLTVDITSSDNAANEIVDAHKFNDAVETIADAHITHKL